MPSKELIEKVASHFEFPDKKTTLVTAENILNEILAALQEPTPAMQLVVSANWGRRTWAEYQQVLAASALGEQSE